MKLTVKLILLFFLCVPTTTFAELPKQIENDFSVLEGLIVMPVGEEYVVDLDASDRLHEGDILTMVGEGRNIIHPETGEIIGTVKVPVGYLQVTRMYSGYSYAKFLFAKVKPEAGIKVMRFEQVPALFVDNQDDEGVLASQLKLNLPQFQWLKPDDVEPVLLTFTLKSGSLVVTTYGGNLLHRYLVTADEQLKPPPERAQPKFVPGNSGGNKKALQKFADELLSTLNIGNDDPFHNSDVGIIRQGSAQEGVWMGPNMGGNPVGIAVADFDGDGLQETAVALNSKLFVAQIREGKYKEEIDVPIPSGLKILSLDTLDLNRNGRPELYLTAVNEDQLSSLMIEFRDGAYEIVIKRVRWFLRVVELPGDELALIGQELDPDEAAFYDKPFYVHIEGGKLVKGDKINLPGKVNIYSFVPFTDYENKQYYAYLSEGDYLKVISAEGVGLWESSEYYGGSETCFLQRKPVADEMLPPTCIRSRLVKTASGEILVALNKGTRLLDRYHKFTASEVISLSWNGYAMVENWRTAGQKGYLGDFTLGDAGNDGRTKLVMAVKFKHKGLIDPARSSIVTYELN